jgi:hypothetical protein
MNFTTNSDLSFWKQTASELRTQIYELNRRRKVFVAAQIAVTVAFVAGYWLGRSGLLAAVL